MDWNEENPNEMPLAQLLANACRLATWRLRTYIERIGIHSGQGRVLVHLHGQDNVPQWRIAEAMNTSPAAITSILKRMERDGWIIRARDPNDQRTVRIRMSDKARALEENVQGTFMQIEEEISAIYTQEERQQLRHLLVKLSKRLSK
ncbi:MAG TPA: MarR family transcriptional regulator, partial [Candidatus Acetothermia bacterium]|nr:MarR family transcriptional regulator [Candidatus Acetothermia bacterium]HEX32768.1 MarR family transcriptional regulator [Candidatus Acetothermia bacterium]